MTINPHDIIEAWAQESVQQKARLVDLVVGAMLLKTDATSTVFSPNDLADVAQNYVVTRVLQNGDWLVSIRPRVKTDPAQPELDLK